MCTTTRTSIRVIHASLGVCADHQRSSAGVTELRTGFGGGVASGVERKLGRPGRQQGQPGSHHTSAGCGARPDIGAFAFTGIDPCLCNRHDAERVKLVAIIEWPQMAELPRTRPLQQSGFRLTGNGKYPLVCGRLVIN